MEKQPTKTRTCSRSPTNPKKASKRKLAKLLDQEYYLVKILGNLVDSGLHECRQVCKKWNEVCKRLAKLSVYYRQLPSMVIQFPEVTHISSKGHNVNWPTDMGPVDARIEPRCFDELVLAHLTSLVKLKCLKVDIADFGLFSSILLEKYVKALINLQSLTIHGYWMEDAGAYFYSHMRFLTNLTLLDLSLKNSGIITASPFTELHKIKHLCVPNLLVNEKRELMFPSLTNLTHLEFSEQNPHGRSFAQGLLEVCIGVVELAERVCM